MSFFSSPATQSTQSQPALGILDSYLHRLLLRLGPVLPSVTLLLPESPDLHAALCEIMTAGCFCCMLWQRDAHNRLLLFSITALTTVGSPSCAGSKMVTSGWPSWATLRETTLLICACSVLRSSSVGVCVCECVCVLA